MAWVSRASLDGARLVRARRVQALLQVLLLLRALEQHRLQLRGLRHRARRRPSGSGYEGGRRLGDRPGVSAVCLDRHNIP